MRNLIGSKRDIVTVDPRWFIIQSLIFSSGGLSGIVDLLMTTTTTVATMTVTMAMMAPFQ